MGLFSTTYTPIIPENRQAAAGAASNSIVDLIGRMNNPGVGSYEEFSKSQAPMITDLINKTIAPQLTSKYIGAGSMGNSAFNNSLSSHISQAAGNVNSRYYDLALRQREGDTNLAHILDNITKPSFIAEKKGAGVHILEGIAAIANLLNPLAKAGALSKIGSKLFG